jgi:hypothetical protein
MSGENAVRSAQDIGGQELSYAEVKAIASGNPAVLTLAEADAELQRLSVLKKNHADEQYLARRSLRQLPETIAGLSSRLASLTADMETASAHAGEPLTIGQRAVAKEDAMEVLGARLDSFPQFVRDEQRIPLGVYRGLTFGLILHPQYPPEVYLQGAITRQYGLSRDHHGPRAVLNALERLVGGYRSDCERVQQDLAVAEAQLRDYQTRLGTTFAHEAYQRQLTALRDQLKASLSGAAQEAGAEPPPSASEIAERIKVLRAAHSIEVTPQRVGKGRVSAEEPVTARIRRRTEALSQPEPKVDESAEEEPLSKPTPTERDVANAAAREAIARRQGEQYERVWGWATGLFGPGWLPSGRHFLVTIDEEERSRREGTPAIAAATVYTVRHEETGMKRHFTVSEDEQVTEVESYEKAFGPMLLEPHPTRTIEVAGKHVHPHRYSLCWAPIEIYHPRSAEQLAALRASRERGKQEREQKKWAEENPLWALSEQQATEEEGRAGLVSPDGGPPL